MLRKSRIQKLAGIYGPFVRFYPGGTEGNDDDDKNLDGAIEGAEKAAKSPEEQAAIDKARAAEQQLEQEQGNTRRANETAKAAQVEAETAKSEAEDLRTKLEAAEAKAVEAGIVDITLDEKDYSDTDVALVRSINALNEKLKVKDARIDGLEKKADGYEAQGKADQIKAASAAAYEELLSSLDEEYGTDCRNAAVKEFNELAAQGKVHSGKAAMTTRVLESCYKRAKAAIDKDPKKEKGSELNLNIGGGGGNAPNLGSSTIKEGSLDDVAKQYEAAGSG